MAWTLEDIDKHIASASQKVGDRLTPGPSLGPVSLGGGVESGLGQFLQRFLDPGLMGQDLATGAKAIPGAIRGGVDYLHQARQEFPYPGGLGTKMGVDLGSALMSQPWEQTASSVGRNVGGLAGALGATALSGGNPFVGGLAFEPGRQAYDLVEDVAMNRMRKGAKALGAMTGLGSTVAEPDPMRSIEEVADRARGAAVGELAGVVGGPIAGKVLNKTRDIGRKFVPNYAGQKYLDLQQPSSVASIHQLPRGSGKETLAQARGLGQPQKRVISEYGLAEGLPFKQGDVPAGRLALEGYEWKTSRKLKELTGKRDELLQQADAKAGGSGTAWEDVRDLEFREIVSGKEVQSAPIKELEADITKAQLNKANRPRAAAMQEALDDYKGDFKRAQTPGEMTTTLQSIDQELRELKEFDASTVYTKDSGLKPSDRAGVKGRIHALKKIRAGVKESLLQRVDEAVPGSRAELDKLLGDIHDTIPLTSAQTGAKDAIRIARQGLDEKGTPARFYYRFGSAPGIADRVEDVLGGRARNLRRMNEAPGDLTLALREMTDIYRGKPAPQPYDFVPSVNTSRGAGGLAGALLPGYEVEEGNTPVARPVQPRRKKKAVGGSLTNALSTLNPLSATPAHAQSPVEEAPMTEKDKGFMSNYLPALIQVESSGDPNAEGPETKYGTAKGLTQLIDSTGEEWHKRLGLPGDYDPFDEEQNKVIGEAYLEHMYDLFQDEALALAAYNWGQGNLRRLMNRTKTRHYRDLENRLPKETRDYVKKVLNLARG